ncbi:unnamed protein product, partial [Effrenium voratum]
ARAVEQPEGLLQGLQQNLGDLLLQVMREQSLVDDRDQQLKRSFDMSMKDLREAKEQVVQQVLVDDDIFGPLTSTTSGLLAGLDIAIAAQAMVLAVLITATKGAFPGFGEAAPEAVDSKGTAAKAPAPVQELLVPCTVVLRFYGRWDDEDQWVLLQSLPLQGVAGSVVNSLRRNFAGPLSKRLLTALVARSARGLVRRRGWKPIVEKTMAEVGREFHLGYLVELPSGGASKRIYLLDPEQRVEEVPSARILRDAVDANRE